MCIRDSFPSAIFIHHKAGNEEKHDSHSQEYQTEIYSAHGGTQPVFRPLARVLIEGINDDIIRIVKLIDDGVNRVDQNHRADHRESDPPVALPSGRAVDIGGLV